MGWLIWNFMVHPLLGEEDFTLSPRWLCTVARVVVIEEGESPPSTRRSRTNLNDYLSIREALYTFGGVGELYRRRSP